MTRNKARTPKRKKGKKRNKRKTSLEMYVFTKANFASNKSHKETNELQRCNKQALETENMPLASGKAKPEPWNRERKKRAFETYRKIKHSNDTCGFSSDSFTETVSFSSTTPLALAGGTRRLIPPGGLSWLRPPRDGDLDCRTVPSPEWRRTWSDSLPRSGRDLAGISGFLAGDLGLRSLPSTA